MRDIVVTTEWVVPIQLWRLRAYADGLTAACFFEDAEVKSWTRFIWAEQENRLRAQLNDELEHMRRQENALRAKEAKS